MLSFCEHLQERFTKIPVFSLWAQRGEIRGHVNPSPSDIYEFLVRTRYKEIRYLYEYTSRTLYVWNGVEAIHKEVIDALPEEQQEEGKYEYGVMKIAEDRFGEKNDLTKIHMERASARAARNIPVLNKFIQIYKPEFEL